MYDSDVRGGREDQVRDDLFHDPAYNTRLFEILSVLLGIKYKSNSLCEHCRSELSEVVIDTCRAWLDDDSNIDYPLNPRAKIKTALYDPHKETLWINTAFHQGPIDILKAGGLRVAADPAFFTDSVLKFIHHVPGQENDGESMARKTEWQCKIYYLLCGKYREEHIIYPRFNTFDYFAHFSMQLLDTLAKKYPTEDRCWPYPSASYPCDVAEAQHNDELVDYIMDQLSNDDMVLGFGTDPATIFREAMEGDDLPYQPGTVSKYRELKLIGQTDKVQQELGKLKEAMMEIHTEASLDEICGWQVGMLDRESQWLPTVPTGDEDTLMGYEVSRMARIIGMVLDDFGMGDLFGPVDVDVDMDQDEDKE